MLVAMLAEIWGEIARWASNPFEECSCSHKKGGRVDDEDADFPPNPPSSLGSSDGSDTERSTMFLGENNVDSNPTALPNDPLPPLPRSILPVIRSSPSGVSESLAIIPYCSKEEVMCAAEVIVTISNDLLPPLPRSILPVTGSSPSGVSKSLAIIPYCPKEVMFAAEVMVTMPNDLIPPLPRSILPVIGSSPSGASESLAIIPYCPKEKVSCAAEVIARYDWKRLLQKTEILQTREKMNAIAMVREEPLFAATTSEPEIQGEFKSETEYEAGRSHLDLDPVMSQRAIVRTQIIEYPRVFSRAAIFACEEDNTLHLEEEKVDGHLEEEEKVDGLGWYGDGVGMKRIADEACRSRRPCSTTRFGSCSMFVDSAECFLEGGNHDDNRFQANEDGSDDEDEDEDEDERSWEFYDGSMDSLKNVVFSSSSQKSTSWSWATIAVAKARSRKSSTVENPFDVHHTAASRSPAQWMTSSELDDVLRCTAGWKAGRGVNSSRRHRIT